MKTIVALLLTTLLAVFITIMTPQYAKAKAYYAPAKDMIENSQAIAIINITKVAKVERQGLGHSYAKEGDAAVERLLKGSLPKQIKIYGQENFICARCEFDPGQYMVFLNRDSDMWIGSNWHLSMRPIKNGKLDWYGESGAYNPLVSTTTDKVIAEIQQELKGSANLIKLPAPLKTLANATILEDQIIGEAPGPSPTQSAFELAKKTCLNDRANLDLVSKFGTPAGKIYASILIYMKDQENAKKSLGKLACCNGSLEYKSGCRMTTAGIWAVASDLLTKGKYINLSLDQSEKKTN